MRCSDCGTKNVQYQHWGPLVEPGNHGLFCRNCFDVRVARCEANKRPLPLGQTEYLKRIRNGRLIIDFRDCVNEAALVGVEVSKTMLILNGSLNSKSGRCTEVSDLLWWLQLDPARSETSVNDTLNQLREQCPLITIT